jgi:hypothetical protein
MAFESGSTTRPGRHEGQRDVLKRESSMLSSAAGNVTVVYTTCLLGTELGALGSDLVYQY